MVSLIAVVTSRLYFGMDFIDPEHLVGDQAEPNTV